MSFTKSQINKLGEKLRREPSIDAESLERLQELRALYDAPMARAQVMLRDRLGVDSTSRLKTVNTIVEKLRREKMRLAEMQDIAGLRIVQEMGLGQQDQLVTQICALFPRARVVDRRQDPSHGYRAVHVIPSVDGFLVEIQVRTRLQDTWAQAMERLADQAGREIRYGGVPAGWESVIRGIVSLSETFGQIEEQTEAIRIERSRLPLPREVSRGQRELQLLHARLRARLKALEAGVSELSDTVRDKLKELLEKTESTT